MDDKQVAQVIEGFKNRISDLIDEAETSIGYHIDTVEITRKEGLMSRRGVKFNIII